MNTHRNLLAWQQAIALAAKVYAATRHLPSTNPCELSAQLRQCAVSIPSQIAEGALRGSGQEFVKFLRFAQGSLLELEVHTLVAIEERLLTAESAALCDIAQLNGRLEELITSTTQRAQRAHARACTPSLRSR